MLIGVPKEIKSDEYRIGLTPESVQSLTQSGHEVLIEQNAGLGIGKDNKAYENSGAEIVETREEIFQRAEMIVKVKEPQLEECALLRPDQILFTYLHLAPDPEQVKALLSSGCRAIAYESVKDQDGTYPLLTPMSEVAGRMAVQAGATCLEKSKGGLGRLIGGVTNVDPAEVVVIGGLLLLVLRGRSGGGRRGISAGRPARARWCRGPRTRARCPRARRARAA